MCCENLSLDCVFDYLSVEIKMSDFRLGGVEKSQSSSRVPGFARGGEPCGQPIENVANDPFRASHRRYDHRSNPCLALVANTQCKLFDFSAEKYSMISWPS